MVIYFHQNFIKGSWQLTYPTYCTTSHDKVRKRALSNSRLPLLSPPFHIPKSSNFLIFSIFYYQLSYSTCNHRLLFLLLLLISQFCNIFPPFTHILHASDSLTKQSWRQTATQGCVCVRERVRVFRVNPEPWLYRQFDMDSDTGTLIFICYSSRR